MEPRTFQAREIKEALALVRRELGPSAVIVDTRRVPGRALGLLGGSFVEVTAKAGDESETGTGMGTPKSTSKSKSKSKSTAPSKPKLSAQRRAERARMPRIPKRSVGRMITDDPVEAVSAAVAPSVRPYAALRRRLLAAMVPRDLCEQWLRQLPANTDAPNPAADEGRLRAKLRSMLGAPAPLCRSGSRVAALVGGTGVGKTTTVAKLAAHAHLVEGKRVALVSLDDQRIGGTTALREYARLLELPMTSASRAGGLARALAKHSEADLVLLDTAGLSPAQRDRFGELADQLRRAGEPVTVHLAFAASTRAEELDRMLHLFSASPSQGGAVAPDALLPTKVDEAVAIGSVFAAWHRAERPLSFATTGQQVPDDLSPATATLFVDLLLGGARS